jgi:putative peptide zinc metalloprotease protein
VDVVAVSESLFSESWYRVATLRPRVRPHAQIHRHLYRGEIWYVLQDHASGRFHRFSPVANLVIGLMNGRRSLQEIWQLACDRLGDDAPTQDDVIQLVSSLHNADVLITDAPPDIAELHERKHKQDRMQLKQCFTNPLSLRFPLVDPEPFLRRVAPLARLMFSPLGAVVWLLVVGWALALAATHWNALRGGMSDRIFSAENLLLIGMVFPVAKLLHELGHALAIKARGGEVHEMGVMVLVMMPIPYVEGSATNAFRDKRSRMLVGAAGMLVELFIAALAMLVWVNVQSGAVHAVAFNVMLIAGVSTLVFNANPLLRFDAYFILSDYLEIPNLAQRANTYFAYLVKRYLFGMPGQMPPQAGAGEKAWLFGYAVLSFFYRIFVALSIALLIAGQYFFIGVLIALWSLYQMVVQPLALRIAWLVGGTEVGKRRSRAVAISAFTVAVAAAIVLWVPAPSWSRTEGVAWAPEDATVRARTDGFVSRVVAVPNRPVRKGDELLITEDPELRSQVKVLEAMLAEQRARHAAAVNDRVQSAIIVEEIAHISERLETVRRRAEDLVIRSGADGVFLLPDAQDAPGRYLRRGDLAGYVMDFSRVSVRVVIPQSEIDLVRTMTRRVELRPVQDIPRVIDAVVVRAAPAATDELPSLALSASGGGEISLDPGQQAPGRDPKAASTLFIFDLEVADPSRFQALGSRVYARFERQPEPLATQAYRAVRRLLLEKFNV